MDNAHFTLIAAYTNVGTWKFYYSMNNVESHWKAANSLVSSFSGSSMTSCVECCLCFARANPVIGSKREFLGYQLNDMVMIVAFTQWPLQNAVFENCPLVFTRDDIPYNSWCVRRWRWMIGRNRMVALMYVIMICSCILFQPKCHFNCGVNGDSWCYDVFLARWNVCCFYKMEQIDALMNGMFMCSQMQCSQIWFLCVYVIACEILWLCVLCMECSCILNGDVISLWNVHASWMEM